MFHDLRDGHHQPCRRGLLGQQRAEIDRNGRDIVQRGVDRGEQSAAVCRDPRAGRRCPSRWRTTLWNLRGIEAGMRVRQREAVRHKAGARYRQLTVLRPRPRRRSAASNSGNNGAGDVESAVSRRADQRLCENSHFRWIWPYSDRPPPAAPSASSAWSMRAASSGAATT